MKNAKLVVTLALTLNDDDDDEDEATTEEHRILRRIVGKSQFLAPRRPDIAFATNRLARSLAKKLQHQTSLRRNVLCDI